MNANVAFIMHFLRCTKQIRNSFIYIYRLHLDNTNTSAKTGLIGFLPNGAYAFSVKMTSSWTEVELIQLCPPFFYRQLHTLHMGNINTLDCELPSDLLNGPFVAAKMCFTTPESGCDIAYTCSLLACLLAGNGDLRQRNATFNHEACFLSVWRGLQRNCTGSK